MEKIALITGITGQDGSYLTELLLDKGYEVHGIVRRHSTSGNDERIAHLLKNPRVHLHYGDLTDSSNLARLINQLKPTEVYNLAAQSHVGVSFEVPEYTAEATGVHGIIIPKRRSALLNATVAKSASGALEYMKVARVTNIASTIDFLKENGVWVFGADMDGEDFADISFDMPCALVIGNEGRGIGPLVAKKCDAIISLPMLGKINSLNASVAAGILMYAVVKSRTK